MISKLRNQKKQKGFTLIELMIVVAIIGILAAVAIPAFMKYIKKSKTTEARQFVKKISDGARAYYMDQSSGPQGNLQPIPKQFPETVAAGISPAAGACCAAGVDKCTPEVTLWADPSWVALAFSVDDPHYYSYMYTRSGTVGTADAAFTAQAQGDLDCDGTFSTFEMYGAINSGDDAPTSSANIYRENETE